MFLRKDKAGATSLGHVWHNDGDVIEVPDEHAHILMRIRDAGFSVVEHLEHLLVPGGHIPGGPTDPNGTPPEGAPGSETPAQGTAQPVVADLANPDPAAAAKPPAKATKAAATKTT